MLDKTLLSRRRFGWPLLLGALLASLSTAPAQTARELPRLTPEVLAHWQAAEDARRREDYVTAVREYRQVIALSPRFAEAYQNLGLVYQLEERWSDAIAAFRQALSLKRDLPGANLFLGIDYCRNGEAHRAVPYLTRAVREKPEVPEAWSWLATAQEMQGEIAAEIATLQKGLSIHDRDIDLLYLLGHAYEALGKQAVDAASAVDSDSVSREEFLAETYASDGYWSEALAHLQRVLARAPARMGVHAATGEVLLHAGRLSRALEQFNAELQIHPGNLRARVRRGEIELLQGQLDAAVADWSEALSQDAARTEAILGVRETGFGDAGREQLPDALRQKLDGLRPSLASRSGPATELALAFIASQDGAVVPALPNLAEHSALAGPSRDCSVQALEKWLASDELELAAQCGPRLLTGESPLPLRVATAHALLETSHPDAALVILEAAPPAQARSPELLYEKARAYKKMALAAYLRLYATAPDSYRAHQLNGDTYAARGEDDKAIEEYRLALRQRPHLSNLHYETGRLLWKNFRTAEARREFQAELEVNPRHVGALISMATIYLYEHQPQEALALLQRAARLEPGNADVHQFLGAAHLQLQQYAMAVKELKLAAPHDEDGKIHYQLARAYQGLGLKQQAAQEFATSSALNQRFHSRNAERADRLAAAEAALREP
jgi:tetratricopeptide (TPR) repeat protein